MKGVFSRVLFLVCVFLIFFDVCVVSRVVSSREKSRFFLFLIVCFVFCFIVLFLSLF